ncbi:hypothetical protein AB4Z10_06240 [Bosea sp. RAF48]|uniref:hypothetical protein n=1 Tax=Bosea sp. RAF48 TaxID=3237480 RepID=UPI003F92AAC3
MKRGNPLSRAARLAKTRREQEEARREREKHFPKPHLVREVDPSNRDENDESEKPRQALTAEADGSHVRRELPRSLRWRIPGVVPASSWENVIFAFVPAR